MMCNPVVIGRARVKEKVKNFLIGIAALIFVVAYLFGDPKSKDLPLSAATQVSSDPACVDLRARMAAPDAINSVSADDLILAQKCGSR